MNVTVEIDGKKITVPQGTNLLEAALQNGIYIPHLCHHPDPAGYRFLPFVHCRGRRTARRPALLQAQG